VLEGVNHSTRVEGQVLAFLTIGGRRRYLQLDNPEDSTTLALLPAGTEIELQNDGNSVAPALAIWLRGQRIDKRATERQALLDIADGRSGRATRVSLAALAERYKAAYAQALALRETLQAEGTDTTAFDIGRATTDLFAAYVAVNATPKSSARDGDATHHGAT
jgi:hypothetical protein